MKVLLLAAIFGQEFISLFSCVARLMAGAPLAIFVPKETEGSRGNTRRLSASSAASSSGLVSSSCWVAPKPKWSVRSKPRSRSREREALPGLRVLAPGRKERRRASAPDLGNPEERKAALELLEAETKAVSTHISDDSRLRTMASWLENGRFPWFLLLSLAIKR